MYLRLLLIRLQSKIASQTCSNITGELNSTTTTKKIMTMTTNKTPAASAFGYDSGRLAFIRENSSSNSSKMSEPSSESKQLKYVTRARTGIPSSVSLHSLRNNQQTTTAAALSKASTKLTNSPSSNISAIVKEDHNGSFSTETSEYSGNWTELNWTEWSIQCSPVSRSVLSMCSLSALSSSSLSHCRRTLNVFNILCVFLLNFFVLFAWLSVSHVDVRNRFFLLNVLGCCYFYCMNVYFGVAYVCFDDTAAFAARCFVVVGVVFFVGHII